MDARPQLSWFPTEFRRVVVTPLAVAGPATWRAVLDEVALEAVRIFFRLSGATSGLLEYGILDISPSERRDVWIHDRIREVLEPIDAIAADQLREAFEWLRVILASFVDVVSLALPQLAAKQPALSDDAVRRELHGPGGSFLRGLALTIATIDLVVTQHLPAAVADWCDLASREMQAAANALRAQGLAVPTSIHIPGVSPEEWRARWVERTTGWLVGSALPPTVLETLVDIYAPLEVWLFGSRARGTYGSQSDWDVLLIVADSVADDVLDPATRWDRLRDVRRHGVDVSLARETEFVESRSLLGTLSNIVATEGYRVYVRD